MQVVVDSISAIHAFPNPSIDKDSSDPVVVDIFTLISRSTPKSPDSSLRVNDLEAP
jgi:hypothetical protein